MTIRTFGAVVVGIALWSTAGAAQAPDAKAIDQGKKLYATYKCDKCHMISGRGSKKGPLDGVGSELSPADIRKWLTTPAEMEAKLEKPPKGTDSMANALKTKGIEPAEIEQLAAYMQSLVKK